MRNSIHLQQTQKFQRIPAWLRLVSLFAAFFSVASTPLAAYSGEAEQRLQQQYDLKRTHVDTDAQGRVNGRLFLLGNLLSAPASAPAARGLDKTGASGVRGAASPSPSAAVGLTAQTFIHQQQALLGLTDPHRELKMVREAHTPQGSHLHYRRYVGDLPLAGTNLSLHFDKDGNMMGVTAQLAPPSDALEKKAQDRGTPTEAERQAVKNTIIEGIRQKSGNPQIKAASVVFDDRKFELVAQEQDPQLVWQGKARTGLTEWRFEVDDESGDLITLYQETRTLF